MLGWMFLVLGLLLCSLVGVVRFLAVPRYYGPISDHFNGRIFHNLKPTNPTDFFAVFKWQLTRSVAKWQPPPRPNNTPPKAHAGQDQVAVTAIFHACVLIQTATVNLITDPVWSERPSPFSWLGPKRICPPAFELEQLPKIDYILLSHNHYDHLDLKTLQYLEQRDQPTIITGLGNAAFLKRHDLQRVVELDWWQQAPDIELSIHFVPAQHFSGRSLIDRNFSLWGGFVIETSVGPVYFAADTGYGEFFGQIQQRFGNIRSAILPIGAYEPRAFMKNVHMNPTDAVRALLDLQAEHGIGIHFDCFENLTDEAQHQAVADLQHSLAQQKVAASRFVAPTLGQTFCYEKL